MYTDIPALELYGAPDADSLLYKKPPLRPWNIDYLKAAITTLFEAISTVVDDFKLEGDPSGDDWSLSFLNGSLTVGPDTVVQHPAPTLATPQPAKYLSPCLGVFYYKTFPATCDQPEDGENVPLEKFPPAFTETDAALFLATWYAKEILSHRLDNFLAPLEAQCNRDAETALRARQEV